MKYYLYKLNFTTALHIGNDSGQDNLASWEITIHSDTFFSALCTEAISYGKDVLLQWVQFVKDSQILFSDALPFRGAEYFLPKPAFQKWTPHSPLDPMNRKLFKKLSFVPLSMFDNYLMTCEEEPFDIHKAVNLQKDLVFPEKRQCVAITGQKVSQPYFVGNVVFNDNCGLYIIVGTEKEEAKSLLEKLLSGLSYSGIGGKRSSGFGKFDIDGPILIRNSANPSVQSLAKLLSNQSADYYMTLNTSLPKEDELAKDLQDGWFLLCRRGGFVQSPSYSDMPQKKRTIYALEPGACVKKTYTGVFCDLAQGGAHPVYRCLKPLFIGVTL